MNQMSGHSSMLDVQHTPNQCFERENIQFPVTYYDHNTYFPRPKHEILLQQSHDWFGIPQTFDFLR